ncbi:hypothetical protein C8R43DRAFT_1148103 [Mycena crocata]|nr:hypothetical protein C8R43DRAFT_1148103 [Mycena crocata]
MNRRTYHSQYRTLALAFTRAGCAQSRIGPLLSRIGKVLNVKIGRSMSRRTVGRVITEAGVKVRIQLGHELAPLALSSDGTSVRNINYEARHITYEAPTYTSDPTEPQTAFKTRFVEVEHSLDHTAQSQFDGWGIANQKIIETYNNSPLGQRDKIEGVKYERDDLWRKTFSYHSDHAPDVGACARKVEEKKSDVIEADLGKEAVGTMTAKEIEDELWVVVQEICDDPEGLDPRYRAHSSCVDSAIPDDLRMNAMQSLAKHLGSKAYDELPESQQLILKRFIKAGCWGHKDLNATAGGAKAMEAAWEKLQLTPPVLLANKDNAATIALGEDADSDAVERAVKASKRGAAKLVSICGSLFRHKEDKKGHQDLHRHYFTKVKFDVTGTHSTVKFPDIQNARYGTLLSGAAELVTYRPSYIEFLRLISDSKQTPGLNHSEQNALNGILCDQTMTECCAMTLYKEAFSDGIVAAARTPGVNHLDLGSLHQQTITHLQRVIDNPDILLDPTTPCSEATVDGKAFRNQFAVDSVHFMASKLPHLEPILVAFLTGALETWKKKTFSSEYDEDGPINSLTLAEKLLYFIPPTNDRNESVFGGLRIHSRYRSASTVAHFSAHTGYHLNETEAFSDAMLNTEEDAVYIMRLARVEDASGAMRKFREELLAFKQQIAEESRRKQKEKEAEAAAETIRL